jgi:hypothetical protein
VDFSVCISNSILCNHRTIMVCRSQIYLSFVLLTCW